MRSTVGCYVHIPFCVRKCAYCDFNSYSGYTERSIQTYVAALCEDIRRPSPMDTPVDTVFFGGGTPTAIPAADQSAILRTVLDTLPITDDAEITTEANPGTMDVRHLTQLHTAGFNRISFGVQSFDAGLLRTMDRIHSADEARDAVRAAQNAGFENVSLDLMFALPRQTLGQWEDSLNQALALNTQHISLYGLMVEEGTGFYRMREQGKLPLPDEDTAAAMFDMAIQHMRQAGYEQYEISNFAKPGYECRHNLHYWRNEPYHGFGCGAASYCDGVRATRIKNPKRYADAVHGGQDLIQDSEALSQSDSMAETMMLGLRLTQEGVDCRRFEQRFGHRPEDVFPDAVARMYQQGLLQCLPDRLVLTERGVFFASDVMMEFLAVPASLSGTAT